MIRRFIIYLVLILFLIGIPLSVLFVNGYSHVAFPVPVLEPAPLGVILVIPLDSRPPCTDYITSLARMAGFKVILPPAELMDDYQQPANAAGMREWLQQNAESANSAIISVDMLVHGGLLASRKGMGSEETADAVLSQLSTIHHNYPQIKLFAFNIIPRLLISEDTQTEKYKQLMAEWSILQETTALFENPQDFRRLQIMEEKIPTEIITRYRKLYAANQRLNKRLIELTQNGILSGLVLGQDDSAPFGLGNMERQRLENLIGNLPELRQRIFLTRGTDEVALTMLGPATIWTEGTKHKVYVHYTEPHTATAILPYMPRPLMQTVAEKLSIAAADLTENISEADFILVVHAGNSQSRAPQLKDNANLIRTWIGAGRNVAVVDLATDWIENQTLLPHLKRNGTLHQLIAYAGWNTASNSIGTAITQSIMSLRGRDTSEPAIALYRDLARVEFLSERILDDWYYQKIYRHQLNAELEKQKVDPYNLKEARGRVTDRINHKLYNAWLQYIRWEWRDAVFPLTPSSSGSYAIYDWNLHSSLPWDRTFEISVKAKPSPAQIIEWKH